MHLANASFRYGDFPAGLSQVSGDFVFDASRMVFDNVTAQAGGGQLRLSGAVTYGAGPAALRPYAELRSGARPLPRRHELAGRRQRCD